MRKKSSVESFPEFINDEINVLSFKISEIVTAATGQLVARSLPPSAIPYFRSLVYVEKTLQDKCVSDLTPLGLVGLFNNVHILLEGLTKHSYRTKNIVVLKADFLNSKNIAFSQVDSHMKKVCTPSDLEIWNKSLSKKVARNLQNISGGGASQNLNAKEKLLFHKYLAASTPASDEVPALMQSFGEELSAKLKSCDDIIDVMAWCHQKIVEIHPYNDCNGRVARVAMNILAIQAGTPPLMIDNEENYMKATDGAEVEKFATYLRGLVPLQNEFQNFTQQAFQSYLNTFRTFHKIN